ncbi:MAG: M48 family metallopeptidase [Candidatus Paceibacterota bacterium]|jgi:hypothetical protein
MFYRIFRRKIIRYRRRRLPKNRSDYLVRKESARVLAIERLAYFTREYVRLNPEHEIAMKYVRVSVRNQLSRWGSCSSKKNLNFNYRILDLSPELRDYIIVHELCHLKELHHGKTFWDLMEIMIPQAKKFHHEVRKIKLS